MLATSVAASVFLVCSGDFRDLRADEEWSIDELSDDGGKLNLLYSIFSIESYRTKHVSHCTYNVLSNLRKKQGQNLGYFYISIITRKKIMDLENLQNENFAFNSHHNL